MHGEYLGCYSTGSEELFAGSKCAHTISARYAMSRAKVLCETCVGSDEQCIFYNDK